MNQSTDDPTAERRVREDLAACYRLVAHFHWDDLIYTHISARVPGHADRFLINPFGLHFSEITASSLVTIDHEGHKLDDSPHPVNQAGFVIHSAIHKARPEIACVLHTHTPDGMAVASLAEGLLPLAQQQMLFTHGLTYHDFEGIATDLSERERLVRDLGPASQAMILRNHGLLTAGRTIPEAFLLMYFLQRSCEIQVKTLSMGRPLNAVPQAVLDKTFMQYIMSRQGGETETPSPWPGLLRLLDRTNPGYRD